VKASLSAVDFAALLRERLWELEGLRLQKAWALGEAVVAKFREPLAGERVLVLSPQVGVLETRYELPRTEPPRQLAEALRRLRGSKLVCVKQLNLDRVAALSLERGGRRVEVVVEWVREGNILVVEEGVVAAALRQREMRDRRVAVGEAYEPPPPRGLDPLSVEPLDAPPPGDPKRTAAAHLSRLVNAPGELVAEALYRCGVDPSTPSSQIHRSLAWRALRELKGMYLKVLKGELEPCLLAEAGEPAAAYPIKLEHLGTALEPAGSFSEAVDKVFSRLIARQPEAERGAALEAERLAAEYAARAEALRRAAAALMADLARFDSLIEELKELKRLLRWDLVEREMKAKHPEVVAAGPRWEPAARSRRRGGGGAGRNANGSAKRLSPLRGGEGSGEEGEARGRSGGEVEAGSAGAACAQAEEGAQVVRRLPPLRLERGLPRHRRKGRRAERSHRPQVHAPERRVPPR
jgi:predicted ribosome quality control (RQC) complex YloA/Tae2 family protein